MLGDSGEELKQKPGYWFVDYRAKGGDTTKMEFYLLTVTLSISPLL